MSERTIVEKLKGQKGAWFGYHIGDVASDALNHIAVLEAENQQWKDMMSDANTLLSLLAEGLGVSYEPHQTLHERLLQAALAKAPEPEKELMP